MIRSGFQAWESKHGDVVKGGYTLKEADGTQRVVEYVADGKRGFQATVKRIGHSHHPEYHGYNQGFGGGSQGVANYGSNFGQSLGYGGYGIGHF